MPEQKFNRPGTALPKDVPRLGGHALFLRDESLRQGIELMFYAYRDFIAEPDQLLAERKLGRAHHRVIYFVGRYPGITVSGLLNILKITKQSLGRVLGRLIREGYIRRQVAGGDRRQRHLELSDKGDQLERLLTAEQRRRMAGAYRAAGAEAVAGFHAVMLGIIADAKDRDRFND